MKGANAMASKLRLTSIITSILMIGAGYILTVNPKTSMKLICTVIAACFLIVAVTRLYAYLKFKNDNKIMAVLNIILAIILLIASLMFFVHPFSVKQIIPIALGIIIIANGLILMVTSVLFRQFLPKSGMISVFLGVLGVFLGWYAATHSFTTTLVYMRYVGITLFVSGAANLINHILAEIGEFRLKRSEAGKAKDVTYTTEPAPAPIAESSSETTIES